MPKVAVVTDSSAYLPAELVQQYGIYVVPLNVHFNGVLYRDNIDITEEEFFAKLATAAELPTTSQPSAGDFVQVFRQAAEGADGIIAILISSLLSGTYASAQAAKEMLPHIPIAVVDSRSTSMGLGFLALAAARAAQEGKTLEEIVALVESLIPRIRVFFVPDTLKYLAKGGRIGGAQALLGSMLSIKPILQLVNGRVELLEKIRTHSKAIARMVELMRQECNERPVHVAIVNTMAPQKAEELRKQVAEALPHCRELIITGVSPVIGAHTGPGALGVIFYTE